MRAHRALLMHEYGWTLSDRAIRPVRILPADTVQFGRKSPGEDAKGKKGSGLLSRPVLLLASFLAACAPTLSRTPTSSTVTRPDVIRPTTLETGVWTDGLSFHAENVKAVMEAELQRLSRGPTPPSDTPSVSPTASRTEARTPRPAALPPIQVEANGYGNAMPPSGRDGDARSEEPVFRADVNALNNWIDGMASNLELNTKTIERLAPRNPIIIFAMESNRGYIYTSIIRDLTARRGANPEVINALGLTPEDIRQIPENPQDHLAAVPRHIRLAVADYVDRRLDARNSRFQKALQEYDGMLERIDRNHRAVFGVAGGNTGDDNYNELYERPHAEANIYALSKHAVVVAASDDRQTPDDHNDDRTADFATRYADANTVTVSIDGVNVSLPGDRIGSGSSYSIPRGGALLTRIKLDNFCLRVAQIKDLLRRTAIRNPNIAPNQGGPGIADPWRAMDEAPNIPSSCENRDMIATR